ncbi:MAG TPA: hypothetical protein VF503_12140 [Sphingobium sp.]|uniref:hypothetical protein n=1 Tax=Sphingobium sp. TaxID=1912891 RepID=UPI002ED54697
MKTLRKVQFWLADRHPTFDRPSLYRRPYEQPPAKMSLADRVILMVISTALLIFGIGALIVGIFVLVVLFSAAT